MAKKKRVSFTEPFVSAWELALIISILVVTLVSGVLLPFRWVVLLSVVGLPLSVFLLVMEFVCFKGYHATRIFIWIGLVMLFMVGVIWTCSAYTFYDTPFLPFWRFSLIAGAIPGVFCTVKLAWKKQKWGIRLLSLLVFTLIAAGAVMITTIHLNYLLDFHPPAEITATIRDKHEHHHTKAPNSYQFTVAVNGETYDLEVPWAVYRKYEEMDAYTFHAYEGAFGEPCYVTKE